MIVLWAILVLTVAIFAWAKIVAQDLQVHGYAGRTLEARAMAHSGVTVALHPLVTKQTPLLEASFEDGVSYKARISSEGGKLNLNWIALGENDPRRIALLKQWLTGRGLGYQEREIFTDCLLDYIDADNVHRLNGAEDEGDYHAANRPLLSIDEVAARERLRAAGQSARLEGPAHPRQLRTDRHPGGERKHAAADPGLQRCAHQALPATARRARTASTERPTTRSSRICRRRSGASASPRMRSPP